MVDPPIRVVMAPVYVTPHRRYFSLRAACYRAAADEFRGVCGCEEGSPCAFHAGRFTDEIKARAAELMREIRGTPNG